MNKNKSAFLLAAALTAGLAGFAPASQAANDPPAAPTAKPGADDSDLWDRCADLMRNGHGGYGGGMMGGGYGGGMMGGYGGEMMGGGMGYGGGMMDHGMGGGRMHAVMWLNLSDDQRARINKLNDELRHRTWEHEGAIQDESAKLRDLYEADKRDPKAIGAEYAKIFDIKRAIIVDMVETQNKVEALLTPEQLKELKELRAHRGFGPGGRHPMMK